MLLFELWDNAIWIALFTTVLILAFFAWAKIVSNPKIKGEFVRVEIKKYFGFLLDRGFEFDSRPFTRGPNGAWAVGLQSSVCKIEITQDRGYISCDIAPIWEVREKYLDVSNAISSESNKRNFYPPDHLQNHEQRLDFYGKLIEKHFDEIIKYIENQSKPT
ncbi:MAG: hypothetical protein HY867_07070 [Chloroflexi bacterium]|nr:hypothetical protein [Chloroflexota bacterium]